MRVEKMNRQAATWAVQTGRHSTRARVMSIIPSITQAWHVASLNRDNLTPTARRILMPMIRATHVISLHDQPRANRLMRALVLIADLPSFAGGNE